jgi:hypothetical protein
MSRAGMVGKHSKIVAIAVITVSDCRNTVLQRIHIIATVVLLEASTSTQRCVGILPIIMDHINVRGVSYIIHHIHVVGERCPITIFAPTLSRILL